MTWDGKYRLFTAEEAQTEVERQGARDMLETLTDRITDRDLAVALDLAIGEAILAEVYAIHARLCRLLPHVTDVAALACFPWHVQTPDDLGAGGDVEPAMHPATALSAHYHSQWEARERNREWQKRRAREAAP